MLYVVHHSSHMCVWVYSILMHYTCEYVWYYAFIVTACRPMLTSQGVHSSHWWQTHSFTRQHAHTCTHIHAQHRFMLCPPLSPQLLKALTPEENTQCRRGLYFQDGKRRVDYILTYQIKKTSSSRRHTTRLTDNAFTRTLRRGRGPPPPKHDPEVGSPAHNTDHHDDDKCLRREEFESNLLEMGLELERDVEVCVCFFMAAFLHHRAFCVPYVRVSFWLSSVDFTRALSGKIHKRHIVMSLLDKKLFSAF